MSLLPGIIDKPEPSNFKLRKYQEECISKTIDGWKYYTSQLIILPTGAGKTVIFAKLASLTRGKTLVLAHRNRLLTQAVTQIENVTGIRAGLEQGDSRADPSDKIVVASVQSLANRLKNWRSDHFELLVCDESHRSVSPQWRKVIRHFMPWARLLGVTATPDRLDGQDVRNNYQYTPFKMTLRDLIKMGHLSPVKIQTCPIKIDISQVGVRGGEFAVEEVDHAIEPYLPAIAEAIKQHAKGRRTLVFVPLISTSHKFLEACKSVGLRAAHVDGESKDQDKVVKRLDDGELDLVSNAMLFTEGTDIPSIDCIVNLRLTKSRALCAQILGRGVRKCERTGKEFLLVLDFLWQHERHQIMGAPAALSPMAPEIVREMQLILEAKANKSKGKEEKEPELVDIESLETEASKQRERKLARELAAKAKRKGELLDAVEFAEKIGSNPELDRAKQSKASESSPMTEKQRAILEKAGVNIETVRGFNHASRLINAYLAYDLRQPASPKQRAAMKRAGHPDAEKATKEDARHFFSLRNQYKKRYVKK